MSSVGFTPESPAPADELKVLREAYKTLGTLLANLEVADGALKILNLGITAQYIKAAKLEAEQVLKAIEKLGQMKPGAKCKGKEGFQDTRRVRDVSR